MNRFTRWFLFVTFFLSGCCALVYQVVWTRLAFASFGIITPVLSVVISVFILGLAVRGLLILASMEPIASLAPSQVAMAMPDAAADDLLEWSPSQDLPGYLSQILSKEFPIERELDPDPGVQITDDHPYNEYFLLRRWGLFQGQ